MLETAIRAARRAGAIQRTHFGAALQVDEAKQHDIKLEVDKLSEAAIVEELAGAFPDHAVLAEERGAGGNPDSDHRWIIDPLDGTVNYYYGIPHYAVSIALEVAGEPRAAVVYDPAREELFTAERGDGARLNGRPVRVAPATDPAEAIVVLGFMKSEETMRIGLRAMEQVLFRVRKVRCTGSAALDLAYVAAGRYTAYYEAGIRHWDIAAGRLILLEAGGRFDGPSAGEDAFDVFASNGGVHDALAPFFPLGTGARRDG